MKSPFPGMDPYVEAYGLWADFHDDLIAEIKRGLAAILPDRYFVQIGERSYVVLAGKDDHVRENFIEIYEDGPDIRLVTHIEVLSPSNKSRDTEGWERYLRKRNGLMLGQANLIEIDLLRGGHRMPMVDRWPESPYYLLVGRQNSAPNCHVWPVGYRKPLPVVAVPLASPDPDAFLALQLMIDAVYERSRYGRRIDYTKPLTPPPLPAEDAAWLVQQLRC